MKELVGKTLYFEPTGNNKRRHNTQELRKGVIEKVARVNIIVRFENCSHTEKLRMCDHAPMCVSDDDHNAGWRIHLKRQDYLDRLEAERIGRLISDKYRYGAHYSDVPVESVRKVADLLGVDITE